MENSDTNSTAVKVTMKDIYLEVQRQGRLLEKIANSLPDTESVVDDHEQRIRRLEMRMGWIFGALGLLGALLGVFSVSLG
tara:strand:+ start:1279 stop:1518 length:240 start_codon:yes stop_codon:yes gene_type:complete